MEQKAPDLLGSGTERTRFSLTPSQVEGFARSGSSGLSCSGDKYLLEVHLAIHVWDYITMYKKKLKR